jgi:quercetin dioxygenase-like cupin family protein
VGNHRQRNAFDPVLVAISARSVLPEQYQSADCLSRHARAGDRVNVAAGNRNAYAVRVHSLHQMIATNSGRWSMNKLIVPATILVSGMIAAVAWSQSPPTQSQFRPTVYFQMPLEKDPSRQVRMQNVILPPGASNQFHRHPGEQWWTIQEGEITYTVKGQAPRVLKVGDWVYVPRGTIHRNQNLTNAPARAVEMNITDKDVPQTEVVPE